MPLFRVTWVKELDCVVEVDSLEECQEAAERESKGNRYLSDYGDFDDDWTVYVHEIKDLPRGTTIPELPKPDNGVVNGKMRHIEDARREWHNKAMCTAGRIACPDCGHTDEKVSFVVSAGEYDFDFACCPECKHTINPLDIIDGTITVEPIEDTETIDMFEERQ